jgi:DNA topoisomerase-1
VLPALRETVERDLSRKGLGKRRVVAAAVRLLDIGYFRVGGEQYAEEHDTYGVATLLKEHVRRQGTALVFDYAAKGSKRRVVSVEDPLLLPVIERLKRRRSGGDRLLAWKRSDGWVDVTSNDVNDYIKRVAGNGFSAKDFRTWSATVLAAVGLAVGTDGTERPSRSVARGTNRATVTRVVRDVAEAIGDTPAVCRSSYIDPAVVDRFEEGQTVAMATVGPRNKPDAGVDARRRLGIGRAVLKLLAG